MRAGAMDQRIVLLRATEAADSFGQAIPTWTVLAQVWAQVEWVRGSEDVSGAREYAEVPVEINVRRSTDTMSLREKDRALVPLGYTSLQEALATTADTSVVVVDAGVFPPENEFGVRVRNEIMLVSAVSANTLTAARGSFGSTAAKHKAGTAVIHLAPLDIVSVARQGRRDIHLTATRAEMRLTA